MAFKYVKTRTFKRTVKVRVPSSETTDKFDEGSFVGVFRTLSRSQVDDLSPKDDARTDSERVTAFIKAVLVGAEGFQDETGRDIAPADAVAVILDDIELCKWTIVTFNETFVEAKAGN